MKLSYVFCAVLMLFSGSAFATGNHPTCPYGGTHPHCNPKPPAPQTWEQAQQQNQAQWQAQIAAANAKAAAEAKASAAATGGDAKASATGGNSQLTNTNQLRTGDNALTLDQSQRGTYNTRSSFVVMSDLPANAMTIIPGAQLTSSGDMQCGYLQSKTRTPIKMWITKRRQVEVGYDEDIIPFRDANGVQQDLRATVQADGSTLLSGHMVLITSSNLSSASNFQFGLQGGHNSTFAGASMGSGSGQQQIGQRIILRDCRYAVIPAVAVRSEYRPAPKRVYKKPVRRKPAICVERPAKVCPR